VEQVKTVEVLNRVLAGKRMGESSRASYEAVFRSVAKMYDEFPSRSAEVNEWLVSLAGYSDQTVRLWFSILKNACKYMEANFEMINPCKAVDAPRVKKRKRRYFGADEIVWIIRACRGEVEQALILTLVDSGCRVGGLSKLKGRDVGEGWFDVKEKTGDRRYRLDVRLCRLLKGIAGGDDNLVFGTSGSALSMRVIRICRRAGLKGEKLGPHTLRHSSASLVAEKTKNVMAVKALLQHDSIQTSMLYIHDVEEALLKGESSPLKLVADKVKESGLYQPKQLTMKAGSGGGDVEAVEDDGFDEVVGDMFPVIKEGVKVHSKLKYEDLMLIREGFMELARRDRYGSEVGRARLLFKRMLRKVK
jgi:integrase